MPFPVVMDERTDIPSYRKVETRRRVCKKGISKIVVKESRLRRDWRSTNRQFLAEIADFSGRIGAAANWMAATSDRRRDLLGSDLEKTSISTRFLREQRKGKKREEKDGIGRVKREFM